MFGTPRSLDDVLGRRAPRSVANRSIKHRRRRHRRIGTLEFLENRTLLSTYPVTSTADSGPGTLRAAITALDSGGGSSNIITFDLGASGTTQTITPASPLPEITVPVAIEGNTEPGFSGAPLVVITGASAGSGADGLTLSTGSSGSVIQNLVINGFEVGDFGGGDGIDIASSNDSVIGCYVGTNAAGTAAVANSVGIFVLSSGATIGGTTTGDTNIISGNYSYGVDATSCLVEGNFIGTNAAGNAAIPNEEGIYMGESGGTIGGSTAGAGNVISGNWYYGVYLGGSNNSCLVEGNKIGTNAAGTAALTNGDGIFVLLPGATIGGTTAGAANLISGNTYGIDIEAPSCLVEGNEIGTNEAGTAAVGNAYGIVVGIDYFGDIVGDSGATIGGTATGAGNTISDNSEAGFQVKSGATAIITNDSITADGTGISVGDDADGTCLVTAQDDNLSGNTTAGITNNQTNPAYAVTATDDWWGSSRGPTATANPGGNGISVSANVSFSPWIGAYTPGAGPGFQPTGVTLNELPSSITVTSTADSGPGTLRAAITAVDSSGGPSIIAFDLGSAGTTQTITLASALPAITVPVDIEGNTEPGFSGSPLVVIAGNSAGAGAVGLTLATGSSDSIVQSLVINGFGGDGIDIVSSNDTVIASFIGTNAAGTDAMANGTGIYVGGPGATVGGTSAGAGNVISGNTQGLYIEASCLVEGNEIGTNAAGTSPVPNGYGVFVVSSGTTIGGMTTGAGNTISDNSVAGIQIESGGTAIIANDSITADGTGILVGDGASDTCLVTAHDDDLSGNTTAGITNVQTNPAYAVTATDDWWGGLHGPTTTANPGGNGTSVSANVIFSPWISAYTPGAGPGFQPADITLNVPPTPITVTSTADSGTGTLRAAIAEADSSGASSTTIAFDLGSPGTAQTISLASPLPAITVPVDIEGNTEPGFAGVPLVAISATSATGSDNGLTLVTGSSGSIIEGLSINGFGPAGINIESTNDSVIGCYIGANGNGIYVGGYGATIGGTATGDANIISGNGTGIYIEASSCLVQGNGIGTTPAGGSVYGYYDGFNDGIWVGGLGATIGGTSAGAGNIITENALGVQIDADFCLVEGNDFAINIEGVYVYGTSGVTIGGTAAGTGNIISNGYNNVGYGDGITIVESSCLLDGNEIGPSATGAPATLYEVGILLETGSAATIGGTMAGAGNTIADNTEEGIQVESGSTATITNDSITADGTGILVGSGADDTSLVTAQYDDLSGNTSAGITNLQTNPAYAVTATNDWWGSLHGPTTTANPGGNGTSVSSNVIFTPWIGAYTPGAGLGFEPTGITLYAVPTQLVFVTEPSSTANSGVAFGTQPVVEAEDASDNLGINFDAATVPGAQAVMTLNTLTGTGTLAGTTAVSPSGGFASFSGLSINGSGTFTLSASASGFGSLNLSGTSSQISVTSGYVVTSTADSGPGSLRQVITSADSSGASSVTITFDLGPAGTTQTIALASPLPAITVPVDIEGNTEPGFSGTPLVVISGASAGSGADGLTLAAGSSGSVVQSLVINGFVGGGDGIDIASANDSVTGCYIGTNAAGTGAVGDEYGIWVGASGATIGGTTPGAGNVISGNTGDGVNIQAPSCLVVGNDIGTNAAGTAAVGSGNGWGIVVQAAGATIGGTTAGARNVISGNSYGVLIDLASSCLVEGNEIGTNAAGTAAVANGIAGIYVTGSGATIGGTAAGAGNVISGNTDYGLDIGASSCLVVGNDIGTNAAGTAAVANGVGICVLGAEATIGGASSGAGNTISDNSEAGIQVESGSTASITNDSITADGTGIEVGNGAGDTSLVTAQYDNLSGNTTAGVTNNQTNPAFAVTATDDWWGSSLGPTTAANPGGNGTSVSANVNFSPWIGVYTPGAVPGFEPTGITLYAVPTQLVFVTEPSSTATSGVAFATQPVIEAEDASGNLGINFDATTVPGTEAIMTLNTPTGAGTLAGTTVVSPSGGFASFSGLSITGSGTFALTASTSGFGSLTVSGTSSQISTMGSSTYVVTSTADGGSGTLRAAITALDSSGGSINTIAFDLGSPGAPQTITLASPLPAITEPVDIEGNSEPGFSGVPLVVISGASAGGGADGLTLAAGSAGSTIQSLVINGFGGDGIDIASTNDTVIGSFFGTNAAGTGAVSNGTGIYVGGLGATIGGTTTGDANVISGNTGYGVDVDASSCLVVGNEIGTDAAGTAAVGNLSGLYVDASDATIGGTTTGDANIISGNKYFGVDIEGPPCLVEGNEIGTNAAGTAAIANGSGVLVFGADVTIGGTGAGAGNVISGNTSDGLEILAPFCLVEGNEIGTNAAGNAPIPNDDGVVDGDFLGATIAGNVISGNTDDGITTDAMFSLIEGNDIGANKAGTAAVANGQDGILVDGLASTATIGGTAAGAGNIIFGNSYGVVTNTGEECLVEGNVISDNVVGIAATSGATTITNDSITGNGTGILVGNGEDDDSGVTAEDDNLSGNTIAGITDNQPDLAVTATDDWWGSLHGPTTTANPGGNGTSVSANVNFSPWIGVYTPGAGPGFQPTDITLYAVPTQLVFVTEPSSTATSGVAFGTQPVVEAEDASGNLGINFDAATVPGAQAVMTLNTLTSEGTLAGTTAVSPSGGFASFSGLNITGLGTFTLTASASGFGSLSFSGTSIQIDVASFIVTSTADSGPGTLRAAITAADASGASSYTIAFDLGSPGTTQTITLASPLPVITVPVDIEGNSEPGFSGSPLVVISGASMGAGATGLELASGSSGSIIQSLVLSGFGGDGIEIASTNDSVIGSFIGTNAAGTAAMPNTYGILVEGSGATIGGTAAGAGNVISGNAGDGVDIEASSCLVEGNLIGTNAAGTAAVANGVGVYVGVVLGSGATIGGTAAGAGNVISGNAQYGVYIDASSCLVEGNEIGTNAAGTAAVANGIGIGIAAPGATIGGTTAGAGNTISDNSEAGIQVVFGATATITNDAITGDGTGIEVGAGPNDDSLVTAQYDDLAGNTIAAITNLQTNPAYAVAATDDWWGSLHGPTTTANPGGNGTSVSTNVNFSPWIGVYTPGAGPGFQPADVTLYAAPTQLVFVTEPPSIASFGAAFATQPVVEAEDASGNLGINFDAATVPGTEAVMTLNVLTGTGTLAGTTVVSPSGGFASFSGLSITGIGTYTLTASTSGFGSLPLSGTSSHVEVASFIVTSTADSGPGTLRAAITAVDSSGLSSIAITFDLGAPGTTQTICLASPLPAITVPVDIEGNSEPGFSGTPLVVISGASAGSSANGLDLAAGSSGSVIQSLVINGFGGDGIDIASSNDTVIGSCIGTDATGTVPVGNETGIYVGGLDATIGGTATGDANVISGNMYDGVDVDASSCLVVGNFIGTNAAGAAAVANDDAGIYVGGSGATIGGSSAGAGNVISGNAQYGNAQYGVDIEAPSCLVQGNDIVANIDGIYVGGSCATIGGNTAGAANSISGNALAGVKIEAPSCLVAGNEIAANGVQVSGLRSGLGVNSGGIYIGGPGATIGGTVTGDANIISGNGNGVYGGGLIEGNDIVGNSYGIYGAGGQIGGTTPGAGNTISGNGYGIFGGGGLIESNEIVGNSYGIYGAGGQIGGTTPGAGNIISGNASYGLYIGASCLIEGNEIGTNAAGTAAEGNGSGILVAGSGATIGGTTPGAGNIISGNEGDGVDIEGGPFNYIEGNKIGTNAAGTAAVPNGDGIYVGEGAGVSAQIGGGAGAGNTISGNTGSGIYVLGSGAVVGNDIGTNAAGIAAVGNGAGIDVVEFSDYENIEIAANLISGNGVGVDIMDGDSGVDYCEVGGNEIGTNAAGTAAVANGVGIVVNGAAIGTTIGGNVISGNTSYGVYITDGNGYYSQRSCVVESNEIGTNAAGTAALANGEGIYVNVAGGPPVYYGGYFAWITGNIISGNTGDGLVVGGSCLVEGNFIGTNAAGTAALPNGEGITYIGDGPTEITGNIISGNTGDGVNIDASGCLLVGNKIGTNAAGTAAIPNGGDGVYVSPSAYGAQIGETSGMNTGLGTGNLISGNGGDGIYILASCLVVGNDIGMNAAGTAGVPNLEGIYVGASDVTIGGTTGGAGNLIAGNTGDGIDIDASSCLVEGNDIGTATVGNSYGIVVLASGATIGGTTTGAGNTISGNTLYGIAIYASSCLVEGNDIGTSEVGVQVAFGGTAVITNDAITGNSTGIVVGIGSSDDSLVTAQYDDLSGNTIEGVTNLQTNPAYAVTATDDWWGSLHGPTATANPGGSGTRASANVSFSPWIGVFTPGAVPGFEPTCITLYAVPTKLVFVPEPSSPATSGVAFGVQPVVEAEDASGNLGINFDASTVAGAKAVMTLNTLTGTGTLAGTTVVSPFGGFASFSGLNITGLGTFTLTASTLGFGSLTVSGTSSQIDVVSSDVASYYIVTSTADSGPGTLRAAITALDSSGGPSNFITFDLGSPGTTQTITLASPLPAITAPVDVEGNTEPGFSGALLVVISGASAGSGANGLDLAAGSSGSIIQSLVINGFGGAAIEIASSNDLVIGSDIGGIGTGISVDGSGATIGGTTAGDANVISGNGGDGVYIDASSCLVEGNDIGTNVAGTTAIGNGDGIYVDTSGSGATIGGSTTAAGNVISGNTGDGVYIDASSCLVEGNDIGTNGDGNAAVANGDGIYVDTSGSGATIGGNAAGTGNVISGNTGDGVYIDASSCLVEGNDIGTTGDGDDAVANGSGIYVAVSGATIGGTAPGAGNVISGNGDGVYIDASSCLVEGNDIGTNSAGTAAVANGDGIDVFASGATIGGTMAGAGNVISGNNMGVYIDAPSCLVEGNYIGTNAAGTAAVANGYGIRVSGSGATIGGTTAAAGNVISGNASTGVIVNGTFCLVEGNKIGTNAAGTAAVANAYGIKVTPGTTTIGGTTNGAGNTISDNRAAGVEVQNGGTATITNDSITGNGTGIEVGIDASDTSLVTAQDDDLSGDTTAGITNNQTNAAYAVTATDDWWGSLHGPTTTANPGGNGTGVSSNVIFTPWIGVYTPGAGPGFEPTGITLYAVPTQLVFVTEPSSAANPSVAFATQPILEAEDAGGNLGINFDASTVPGTQAVMTLNVLTGTGALAGTTSVSPSGGFADFTGLNITGSGTFTLTADTSSFGSLNVSGTSSQIIVTPPRTMIAIQPPLGVLAGSTFGLTIDEVNGQNQIDTSYNGSVMLSLANNPGDSSLGGTLTVQAVNGVATFSGLTISNPGLAYTLQVSATGSSTITTAPFDVAGYQLIANGPNENLVWFGTTGSDQVQFTQTGASTVQITVSELAGVAASDMATVTGVTGNVVVHEYDVAGVSDVINGGGLTTIASMITVGNGNDTIIGGGGANIIVAGNGDNTIYGNDLGNSPNASGVQDPSNTITVGNGNNIIYGNYSWSGYRGGDNTITAGDGNNTIYGNYGYGDYDVDGAEGGNNIIKVGNGDNTIYGNYGNADGGEGGNNTITAGDGNDIIFGNGGGNDPNRQGGNNFIQVGNGTDTIYGNVGGDGGEGGNNTILTGSGQDTIYGNFGGAAVDGGEGEGGNNLIVAGGGNDTIYAHCGVAASGATAQGRDLIIGGTGADTVYGWPAGYTLSSNTGDLFIAGTTDLSLAALDAVLAEWDSSDSYATRVADLSGANGTIGANGGNYLISGTTVFGSAAVDEIFGTVDSDDDWYLVTSNDELNNVDPSEVTPIPVDQD